MSNVWILTREENQYDQYGEYFVAVFKDKPSESQLTEILTKYGVDSYSEGTVSEIDVRLLSQGGGRDSEDLDTWFNLKQVPFNTLYPCGDWT